MSSTEEQAWEWVRRLCEQADHVTLGISVQKYDVTGAARELAWISAEAMEAMTAAARQKVSKGQQWRFIHDGESKFFTKGSEYRVLSEVDGDGWFTIEDDTHSRPHHWKDDEDFRLKFAPANTARSA